MIWVGIAAIGITSAAFVAEVIPTMRRYWRKSRTTRTGSKVKTVIFTKEKTDEL